MVFDVFLPDNVSTGLCDHHQYQNDIYFVLHIKLYKGCSILDDLGGGGARISFKGKIPPKFYILI